MKRLSLHLAVSISLLSLPSRSSGGEPGTSAGAASGLGAIIVNSLEDIETPGEGTVTLRSALAMAATDQSITFSEDLDGGTIRLLIVAEQHSVLVGEYMEMVIQGGTGTPVSTLIGYFDRDYGKSALYAKKNVVLDASALPNGITIACDSSIEARVLAVYGDLTMTNVMITGGKSVASMDLVEPNDTTQTATLARGGGLAVWGKAKLTACTLYDNLCDKTLDTASERDQGAFGGGLYADVVELTDCVLSGNACSGSGVAGGGVCTVGGASHSATTSLLNRCAITGNKLTASTAYGAGIYSDGGGIGKAKTLKLTNCTVAWNLVDGTYSPYGYWRGGAIYMSNGYMQLQACTIVDNHVKGYWREDLLGKCSLAGGVAATIGLAHAVESMTIGHSIITGNTVHDLSGQAEPEIYNQDIFTGSLQHFNSRGYNGIGVIDFSQMLVPVGEPRWWSLCRNHYPKVGDASRVAMDDVLNTSDGLNVSSLVHSKGIYNGQPVVLSYEPAGAALDVLPLLGYQVDQAFAEYEVIPGGNDNFLEIFLDRAGDQLVGDPAFAAHFITTFEAYLAAHYAAEGEPYRDPDGNPITNVVQIAFFGPAETWVKETSNYPLILFWHKLAVALRDAVPALGDEGIGDAQWAELFTAGPIGDFYFRIVHALSSTYSMLNLDQRKVTRPDGHFGDIGAVEKTADVDGDGMDDQWEKDHFGGMSEPTGAASYDVDNDWTCNLYEFMAGTNPTNAASVFRIVDVEDASGQTLYWLSVTNRVYSISKSTNLFEAWPSAPFTNGIPGDVSGTNRFTDPTPSNGRMYYRIDVEPP